MSEDGGTLNFPLIISGGCRGFYFFNSFGSSE